MRRPAWRGRLRLGLYRVGGQRLSRIVPRERVQPPECPPGWSAGPPDFVGVGVAKAGTTWWHANVAEHPAVHAARKELHFFDRFHDREPTAEEVALYHRFFPRPEGGIAGEWTPRYVTNFWTPRLLRQAAPDAKLLLLLRDPLDRYLSAVAQESNLAAARRDVPAFMVRAHSLEGSLYAVQLKRLLRHFPREQLLVLQYERCLRQPERELRRTFTFLGLEPHISERLREAVGLSTAKPELSAEHTAELVSILSDDAHELARLCPEIDLELWPSARGGS